jgi:hypothetical protein
LSNDGPAFFIKNEFYIVTDVGSVNKSGFGYSISVFFFGLFLIGSIFFCPFLCD